MTKSINSKRICFLTSSGFSTPRFIWKGFDEFGTELHEITKKGLRSKIETNNRVFTENPELLKSTN